MTTELKNMKNVELLAEVVNDLKNHHLVGLEARHFKITSLRSLYPGLDALFDWISTFFKGTDNKNWLKNEVKITMVGTSANSTRQRYQFRCYSSFDST
jgi:hypothetical protein